MNGIQDKRLLVVCALGKHPEYVSWLRDRLSRDRFLSARAHIVIPVTDDERDVALRDAIVYATYRFSPSELRRCRKLQWLNLGLAGVESALFPAFVRSRITLTSSVGSHENTVPVAAWGFILSFVTGLHEGYMQKQKRVWHRKDIVLNRRPLLGQRLLVIGTGEIGRRIGRLGRPHGMEIWGVRRSRKRERISGFDRVVDRSQLHRVLPDADYVVVAVPGGRSTRHLIGAAELRLMKTTAYLINIARGSVIDETALVKALQTRQIAGAGLDVFEEEPLPSDHPFYALPNVAMTPHTSGDTIDYGYRVTDLFLKNLRRYIQGKPLLNIVDKKRGY